MTNQTNSQKCLGGSPVGISFSRLCTLTLAAILATSGAAAGFAQDQSAAAKPAKPVSEKKPEAPVEKISHGYMVHQSIEVGGRITSTSGSGAMWNTLVNQGSGGRVLGESLELHSVDTTKTPFFDSLSANSSGYGGDPYDSTYVNLSKGRIYDFAGSFRRDRQYFDYNLLDNSLLTTSTAATPALVAEPDSLHLFNTVRRNTDTLLTLLPLSVVSFRAGFNHGTMEGPTYSTVHYAGDVEVLDWFRNSNDTYTGGVDVKLAPRTSISFDQFYVIHKGDTSFRLAGIGAPSVIGNGVYPILNGNGVNVSLGIDTLATTTCGAGAARSAEVVNGFANPFCSGTIATTSTAPIRANFPTEQVRFSSHYWNRLSFNGRLLYSGSTGYVNHFNQTFTGFNTRTSIRQEIQTGGQADGRLATNKRANSNGDFGVVAELNKHLSVTDTISAVNLRTSGFSIMNNQAWTAPAGSSLLTPLSSITPTTTSTINTADLTQKMISNTVLATATVTSQFKLSGGWRFKTREITGLGDDLSWHENWVLLGAVVQPTQIFRLNVNFDLMNSKAKDSNTTTNSYTREAPDKLYHFRARGTVKPSKFVNFAATVNDYEAKNDDPLINHTEHRRDFSFDVGLNPTEQFGFDFNYAYDDVYSKTDLCYAFTANVNAPLPAGAANTGTCTVANSPDTGGPTYLLGHGNYDAPVNFFGGSINYAPTHYLHFNGGVRLNNVNGTAELLNPYQVPGALQSHYLMPFADAQINIASQWSWHGNWSRYDYNEQGAAGSLPSRNTTGDVVTLGVKYAF